MQEPPPPHLLQHPSARAARSWARYKFLQQQDRERALQEQRRIERPPLLEKMPKHELECRSTGRLSESSEVLIQRLDAQAKAFELDETPAPFGASTFPLKLHVDEVSGMRSLSLVRDGPSPALVARSAARARLTPDPVKAAQMRAVVQDIEDRERLSQVQEFEEMDKVVGLVRPRETRSDGVLEAEIERAQGELERLGFSTVSGATAAKKASARSLSTPSIPGLEWRVRLDRSFLFTTGRDGQVRPRHVVSEADKQGDEEDPVKCALAVRRFFAEEKQMKASDKARQAHIKSWDEAYQSFARDKDTLEVKKMFVTDVKKMKREARRRRREEKEKEERELGRGKWRSRRSVWG